ncbi:hypothetical protein ACOJBO_00260 [Rhizobium beringeri]
MKAAHPALSEDAGTVLRGARKRSPTDEGETRKRSGRGKTAEAIEVIPLPSPTAPTAANDAITLDKEIRLLRNQTGAQASAAKCTTEKDAGAVRTLSVLSSRHHQAAGSLLKNLAAVYRPDISL